MARSGKASGFVADFCFLDAGTWGAGDLGISTTAPAANLDVSGTIRHTGILIDASDRRLKSNIRQLPSSLEAMLRLNPVSFTMNDNPQQTELGFIAQDVQPLFPDLVITGNDPSKTLSLNYPGFIAPIVKAMQEMKAEWEAGQIVYNLEIGELKAANDNLRSELKAAKENYTDLRMRLELVEHHLRRPAARKASQ